MQSSSPVSLSLVTSSFCLRWCEIDQCFLLQTETREGRKEPDSQPFMTDGETIDEATEKEVLLFTKLMLLY